MNEISFAHHIRNTFPKEMIIIIYSTVRTGPKSHPGGDRFGFFNALYHVEVFFIYLDHLVKLTNRVPAIITVTSWNTPIALRKITGNTQSLISIYATRKSNSVFITHPTRIDNRCIFMY